MAFMASKKKPGLAEEGTMKCNTTAEDREVPETLTTVSSHLYLKPSHTSETLDKDQVLRRIRHRKRINKVSNALQELLSSPFSSNSAVAAGTEPTNNVTVGFHDHIWLDDAFSAP